MDLFDVAAAERAEKSIDEFINSRSKAREKAHAEEEAWKESTRRVNEKHRRANRWAWISHHGRMHHAHLGIAEDHARRRAQLLAEGGYEPDEASDLEETGEEAAVS